MSPPRLHSELKMNLDYVRGKNPKLTQNVKDKLHSPGCTYTTYAQLE